MTSPAIPAGTSGVQSIGGGSGTTFVPTKPVGLAAGDTLVAAFHIESSATITAPSGFTNLVDTTNSAASNPSRLVMYGKIADSTDAAATNFSWSWTGAAWRVGALIRLTGTVTSGTFAEGTNSSDNGDANSTTGPNVALTGNTTGDDMCIMASDYWGNGATWSAASGWTITYNSGDNAGIQHQAQASGGAPAATHVTRSDAGSTNSATAVTAIMSTAAGGGGGLPFFMQEENLMVGGLGRKSGNLQ